MTNASERPSSKLLPEMATVAEGACSDLGEDAVWDEQGAELQRDFAPILSSPAFTRLAGITFLGVLSPKYAMAGTPAAVNGDDGSRRNHSLAVALLNRDLARTLGFSERAGRYAVVWGLLHDIGNWPLSHSGEYAFTRLTGRTPRQVRSAMIEGAAEIPVEYRLHEAVHACGLDVAELQALMSHRHDVLDREMMELGTLLSSPLVPDAVEGTWRCARTLAIDIPNPVALAHAFVRDTAGTIRLRVGMLEAALGFWRIRGAIYGTFFNAPAVIDYESAWSEAILKAFPTLSLETSFALRESEVVARARAVGLSTHPPFSRYKPPVRYSVNLPGVVTPQPSLTDLSRMLVSGPADSSTLRG